MGRNSQVEPARTGRIAPRFDPTPVEPALVAPAGRGPAPTRTGPAAVDRAADRLARRVGAPVLSGTLHPSGPDDELRRAVARAPVSVLAGEPGVLDVRALATRLGDAGLVPEFLGSSGLEHPGCSLAILRGVRPPAITPAPDGFSVVGVLVVFNEADVIATSVRHLVDQGVAVYLVDNWSTDGTLELGRAAAGDALAGWERFPTAGPSPTFDWTAMLERVERLGLELDADWVVCNDADELRESPWPGVGLRDALHHVADSGYNAVNYSTLNFALTTDHPDAGADPAAHLTWFEPQRMVDLSQLNTWRPSGVRVDLAPSGRHHVTFPGCRVFPYNFLMRHYPVRNVEQGLRKINRDRLPRYRTDERLLGWHHHYRPVGAADLVRDPDGLFRFDTSFAGDFLLERLTGVGFEPAPASPTARVRTARLLRRVGLLDVSRRVAWRLRR